jgi:hypothetical protein
MAVAAGGGLWGWSEWALRWPSAAAATVAVALLARVAMLLRPRPAPGAHAMPRDWSPFWAALLLALHPLLIYYAQEARMYALLLALLLAAAVALAPALQAPVGRRRWLLYTLWATLALYTHYFAAFVLLAFALGFALSWVRPTTNGPSAGGPSAGGRHAAPHGLLGGWVGSTAAHRTEGISALLAHGLMLLLYAPWALIMVQRLGDDASYWQGRLKLGEALAESAGRFVAGETQRERLAIWLAVGVLLITAAALIWLWRAAPGRRGAIRFALLWLLAPVVGVLALAWFAPKFNVRYLFAALPGLVLLWALPAAEAMQRATRAHPSRRLLPAATLAALLALLAIFAWSTLNWFTNPTYTKAQWRELAAFLRPRLAPDEAVFLVSGHAWPVWAYYAPDIPATRLPNLDVLDVETVLDFATTAGPLRETLAPLAERPGAWLVAWQDEVVDPNEVLPIQLELGGREKGSSAQFNQLTLRRWSRINLDRIADAPPVSVPVGATFGDALTLDGYHLLDNGDLLLIWQASEGLAGRDLQVALEVSDDAGAPVASVAGRRPAGYNDPTFRWQPGELVVGRIPAAAWLGAAPAARPHTVTLRVFDGADPSAAPLPVAGAASLRLEGLTPILD